MRSKWTRRAVLLVVALAAGRAILFQGAFRPIHIASGSMAPTLRGPHFAWNCADCRAAFTCDDKQWPANDIVVCPYCGSRENTRQNLRLEPGQRVYIDRLPFFYRDPRRGEVVTFQAGDKGWEVKRVVALPGEQLSIQGGDIWIDGQRHEKSMASFFESAILVHDARFPARKSKLPPRWRSDSTAWRNELAGDALFSAETKDEEVAWLKYHHRRGSLSAADPNLPTPVVDLYGDNQNVARPLFVARDLVLEIGTLDADQFSLRVGNGLHTLEVKCSPSGSAIWLNDRSAANAPPSSEREQHWRLGFVDNRALVERNGRVVWRGKLPRADESNQDLIDVTPASVGVIAGRIQITALKLWRDIHYLDPEGIGRPWQHRPLKENEFFVLGDNCPVSMDSRMRGPIRRNLLAGKVLRAR